MVETCLESTSRLTFFGIGTKWFPGENVGIGKDHTLFALEYGYVRYYRDPLKHPKRRYIGVALAKEGPGSQLPTPRNAPTRRRLGMYAVAMKALPVGDKSADEAFLDAHLSANSVAAPPKTVNGVPAPWNRPGTLREANASIGLAAERKGVQIRDYDRKDRWLAWRRRSKRIERSAALKAAKGTKTKKKPKPRRPVQKK
jgi:large subunit ribosomal protein L27